MNQSFLKWEIEKKQAEQTRLPWQVVPNVSVFEVRWEACSGTPESQVVPRLWARPEGWEPRPGLH